jgi:hypothetical protein
VVLQSQVGAILVTEETLVMTLARQEEIIVETLETVISIDLSEKRLLTMIGNVKSVITLIFHLGLNVIDAENPNQVVEVIAETVDHAETTVQDEIIEVAAETADHAETTVLEEREAHAENADHVETTAHPEKEAHAESVDQEEMTDQAGIVVEVTESVDQEEKEAVAKSGTQPFVNSVALEVNHLVMRTTEDPNPLILVH